MQSSSHASRGVVELGEEEGVVAVEGESGVLLRIMLGGGVEGSGVQGEEFRRVGAGGQLGHGVGVDLLERVLVVCVVAGAEVQAREVHVLFWDHCETDLLVVVVWLLRDLKLGGVKVQELGLDVLVLLLGLLLLLLLLDWRRCH